MSAGWPARTGRAAYGPPLVDERRVADPRSELGATVLGLAFWQLGGLGVCAPKVALLLGPDFDDVETPPTLLWGVFAWDQQVYANLLAPFRWFSMAPVDNDVGLSFDAEVPGMDDEQQPLELTRGIAAASNATTYYRTSVALTAPNQFRVSLVDGGGVHRRVPVAVLLW